MSEISKIYDPSLVENKWYAYWLAHKFFHSEPNPAKKPYTIVIPPPNVTGVLHMGHMLNNTIQDVLIRRKRMQGFEACWIPGTDHASIATEAKVVAMLKEKGINKKDLSREEFLKYAWEWKEKYGGIILEQLKKLGASCDWDRTRFTMEEPLSEVVIDVFIDLYNKGLIYRGARMVNWDPQGLTAVSDEEVIYKEVNSKLYYIKYFAEDGNGYFTVATTRPETIMGDVAICVNPNDERYKNIIGKKYLVPLINRPIPIITDEAVDIEYGTGSLKVTPAHDIVDYNIGLKYNLEVIDILNPNGTLNEKAQIYVGEDRFVARKKIAKELEEKGFLVEAKDMVNKVGTSERTGAVIEPRISTQWFCSMTEMAKPALENVLNGNIKLHPNKFINTYKHWMENVQDWCISRQLWWGQQIPAWYLPNGDFIVAKTKEEAIFKIVESKKALHFGEGWEGLLNQDEDVLDTWFSSWLWPISVFSRAPQPPKGEQSSPINETDKMRKQHPLRGLGGLDFDYYYPTQDLVTAPEILFFWVARMVMAGYEFKGELPFSNVYLTGIVRDKQGRKMSKSLGNSPDPIDLIEKFSADGVRVGMLYASPAGNDLLFDEKYCEQGRNFANKLWNAFRLIKGWEIAENHPNFKNSEGLIAAEWFDNKFNQKLAEIEDNYDKYRISDALKGVYSLVWDDFCAWYLEMIKPEYGQPIDKATYEKTIIYFEKLLKVVHPFMPFITEEIWHEIGNRSEKDCIIVAQYPTIAPFDHDFLGYADKILDIVSNIRNFRSSKGMSPKEALKLLAKPIQTDKLVDFVAQFEAIIKKLVNISEIVISNEALPNSNFIVGSLEFHIPIEGKVDVEKEKAEAQKEIDYLLGFLKSVDAKLSNEKFVANAKPDILANEQKKKVDAEAKLVSLQKIFAGLN